MPLQPLLSKRSALALITGAALALSPLPLLAQDAAQKGYEIAARSDVSDNGFRDSAVDVTMELKNAAGQSSSRQLRILTLERASAKVGDKSISIFSTPADIDGTAVAEPRQAHRQRRPVDLPARGAAGEADFLFQQIRPLCRLGICL